MTIPVAGGVSFVLPFDTFIFQDLDFAAVETNAAPKPGANPPAVLIARIEEDVEGNAYRTVDEMIEVLGTTESGSITERTDTIEALDLSWQAFDLSGDVGQGEGPQFASAPGGTGNVAWTPFPVAVMYLAEIDGGVMALVVAGEDAAEVAISQGLFDELLPTLTWAG